MFLLLSRQEFQHLALITVWRMAILLFKINQLMWEITCIYTYIEVYEILLMLLEP